MPLSSWSDLIGHEPLTGWFANAIRSGRMTGSLLFVGPAGVGKTATAFLLAKTLLCETRDAAEMNPCGRCPGCIQTDAETHPDLIQVSRPADRSFIPLDRLIGPPDARMQSGFCRDVRLKPSRGNRKIALLHDADHLNEEGANCLLKTLEEPPPGCLVILIGTSEQRQLPTIRSRCRVVRFRSPGGPDAAKLLRARIEGQVHDAEIESAVALAAGDLHVAMRLLREGEDPWRHGFIERLSGQNLDPVALTRLINERIEGAGKDVSRRRDAMRDVFSIAIQHFHDQLRKSALSGTAIRPTHERLDRSIRAIREIDRSANQATLVECYAADIAAGTTGDRGAIGS